MVGASEEGEEGVEILCQVWPSLPCSGGLVPALPWPAVALVELCAAEAN